VFSMVNEIQANGRQTLTKVTEREREREAQTNQSKWSEVEFEVSESEKSDEVANEITFSVTS
jgi:hypothetical protein